MRNRTLTGVILLAIAGLGIGWLYFFRLYLQETPVSAPPADTATPAAAAGPTSQPTAAPVSPGQSGTALFTEHRSGQTFLTWAEDDSLEDEIYRVYRSNAPVGEAGLDEAQFLAQLGENSSRLWTTRSVDQGVWETRLIERMVIRDNAEPLAAGVGALVWTVSAEDLGGASGGAGYYAVTITKPGENRETLLPEYTIGPVDEAVVDPLPVEYSRSPGIQPGPGGHYYLQYMDLHTWNPTFHTPNSLYDYYGFDPADPDLAHALGYAYDYAVFEPTPDLCGGAVPETLPVLVFLHGAKGNRYGQPTRYPYPYCAYGVYPIDQNDTWYFGFARDHDYRLGGPVGPGDVIENFTEQRILRMIYDLMRRPPGPAVDPQRVYLFGHSMGGTGALAFAERYPNVFAAIYSGQPVTWFRATEGIKENWPTLSAARWGAQELNLPVAISAPGGWAAPLQKYNGVGVFDWTNLRAAFDPGAAPDRTGDEMVPFGIDHGTVDDSVKFPSQGQPTYPLLNASPRAWAGAVTETPHHWSVFAYALPNLGIVDDSPFYHFNVVRDETVPGLSFTSTNEPGLPGGPTTYNQTILWSASWNPWDGAPVDRPAEWQMSFCSVATGSVACGGEQQTVDITPRRLQNFAVVPGQSYQWEVIRLPGGAVTAGGIVPADLHGLITVPGVQVTGQGIRLRIWAEP